MSNPGATSAGITVATGVRRVRERLADLGWYAILTFLVAIPATGVWVPASGHDYARAVEVALCLVCALALAPQPTRHTARLAFWSTAAAAALALLMVAATLHAPNLRMALRELTLWVGLAGIAWLVASRPAQDLGHLLVAVSIAAASYTALVGLGLATNLSVANDLRPFDLLIGYDNGRFFNHMQTSMLPLLVLATLHPQRSRWIARMAWFGLIGGLALLAVSEGRATGLALVVGAVIGWVLLQQSASRYVCNLAIGAAAAAVVYALVFIALPRLVGLPVQALHVEGVTDAGSAQSRWVLWEIAGAGIRRSPWVGIGPMHFSHTWNADAAHPHNIYLQIAEEWGVPMLLLLLAFAGVGLGRLRDAVRACLDASEQIVGATLFITVTGIAVDGMLSGNFVMPVSQVWIAVVFGSAIGWVRRRAAAAGPAGPVTGLEHAAARGVRVLPLLAMLWLAVSITPDLELRLFDRAPEGTRTDAGAPRFWSNGWF